MSRPLQVLPTLPYLTFILGSLLAALVCADRASDPASSTGYLDVVADCGADNSGLTDTTAALQKCINASYQYGGPASAPLWPVPLFFPSGTYLVSDTLLLHQTNPGGDDGINVCPSRFLSLAAFGSSASPVRPVIRLAPNSPGFSRQSGYKSVVYIWNDVNDNVNMNNVWRGIDIDLTAEGNEAAVGLQHAGAQGASVSDVTVWALPSTFACFAGLNGAGGEHGNVACYGARYGVYVDDCQPVPVLVGATLVNQSISALLYFSQESMSLVGVTIVTAPDATGPAIVASRGNHGMSIIDVTVDCTGDGQVAIHTPASLYIRDMYVRGCKMAIEQNTTAPLAGPEPADGWQLVEEWARGTATGEDTGPYYFTNVVYVDGVRSENGSVRSVRMLPSAASPPLDLLSRHVWDASAQAGVDSPGVANAKSACGARGDDKTDDTAALQACLNQHSAVFLPPGRYRISATLDIPAGGSLVGMGSSFSFLLAATTGFTDASPAAPAPLLRTATDDADGAPTVVAFLGLLTWQHLADVFTLDWRTHHPLSLWRSNFDTRECECLWTSGYQRLTPPDIPCSPPVNLTIPKALFRGLGRVHQFVNDDTGHILSTGAKYRAFTIRDTTAFAGPQARTRFYGLNLEHAQSEANAEIANASWVDIYSIKTEGNLPILWLRGDVAHVSMLSLGGGFTAFPANWSYPPDFASATPSGFRVDEGVRDVTFALLQDHGYGAEGPFWPPTRGDCRWTHYYPFPGESTPLYPYSTYPNATMWNCWYGYYVSTAYWSTMWSPAFGLSQPGDKPILWRVTGKQAAVAAG